MAILLFLILNFTFFLPRKRSADCLKTKTKRAKVSNREDKVDKLLDAIPMVLEAAQTAAKEHNKALKKWSIMHGLDSSSDEE